MTKIAFTGDLFLGGDLINYKGESNINIKAFNDADLRICNLEQGSGDNTIDLKKSTVSAPLNSLKFLNKNKIEIVNLANNHIQDKGVEGFKQKIKYLNTNKIRKVGAGTNLNEASKAVYLGDNYYLISFCTFNKKYLKKVQIAGKNSYGVNPLTYQNVKESLNRLPNNSKAIIYFHWGRENVWLPPYTDIKLARRILENDRVYSIIGMHSHRIQGCLKYHGKKAYFSLGNFLFPNFFMIPRTQIFYPKTKPGFYHTTKEYHPVMTLTYKMWKTSNRKSLLLILDTNTGKFESLFVKQDKYKPVVHNMDRVEEMRTRNWFDFISYILKVPAIIYNPLEFISRMILSILRFYNIFLFYFLKEKYVLKLLCR